MAEPYVSPYPSASRREMLRVYATLALLAPIPAMPFAWPRITRWWHADDERRKIVERVSALVIPDTDTPGAEKTGVAQFVELALRHGLDGTRDPGSSAAIPLADEIDDGHEAHAAKRLLTPVKTALDEAAGGDFLAATPEQQTKALTALDAQAFRPGNDDHPWHKLKDLILTGYYTSQIGGSKELNYELVPGRWDSNIALGAGDHAYSSDWTAVDFG